MQLEAEAETHFKPIEAMVAGKSASFRLVRVAHPATSILVPVCNLINGTTITRYDACALDELEFFHTVTKTSRARVTL